ncbi:hypothetical protein Tco_1258788 [Tanacetum coccineum]
MELDEEGDGFGYDKCDSGAASDDFNLLELGETGEEFCQIGDQTCRYVMLGRSVGIKDHKQNWGMGQGQYPGYQSSLALALEPAGTCGSEMRELTVVFLMF